jgi:hypothetical protein
MLRSSTRINIAAQPWQPKKERHDCERSGARKRAALVLGPAARKDRLHLAGRPSTHVDERQSAA